MKHVMVAAGSKLHASYPITSRSATSVENGPQKCRLTHKFGDNTRTATERKRDAFAVLSFYISAEGAEPFPAGGR